VQEIRDRLEKLRGEKPHWPDAQNRYCTSDQKRAQIDKVLRCPHWPSAANRYCTSHQKTNQIDKVLRSPWPTATQRYCTADQKRDQIIKEHRPFPLVISAMGIRAEESASRRKKSVVTVASRITAAALQALSPAEALAAQRPGQRLAMDWLPIHGWSEDEVWQACGSSLSEVNERRALYRADCVEQALEDWPAHPAYVFGNQRLSCALCVLASRNDIAVGACHNPELLAQYVAMERESGFTFRKDLSLAALQVEQIS
jgi:3'-phosphoadenosine 5'-phosphosulfate sulfotransferase (PAPS reductase)/FAD synthetase